jgi:23S rRNA pseudouridine1911/1915/1917 synthase
VHLSSLGHPVVGDALYGAPREIRALDGKLRSAGAFSLARNFLHAAELELVHPCSGTKIAMKSALPDELRKFLATVEGNETSRLEEITHQR